MPDPFIVSNWYWFVAGDQTRAYSSKLGDYVASSDPTFQAWRAAGNIPTRIGSEAELGEVLSQYSIRPAASGILDGYTEAQAVKLTVETVAKILFNHENRIRTLAGQAIVTPAQFKAFIKGQM